MANIHVKAERAGILLLTFKGGLGSDGETDQFVADIGEVGKAIKSAHRSDHEPVCILINISDFQAGPDTRAFDALVSLAKEDRDIVGKTAVFGGSFQLQTLGQTAAYLAGRDNICFFPDKASALEWLDAA